MSQTDEEKNEGADASPPGSGIAHLVWQQLPYLVALVLAIAGVAYTNVSRQPLVGYWEFLALAIGVVCIVTKWPELEDRESRLRLIWTQALHWIAVLVAMNIILASGVQQMLPTPATSLVLLTLLALGSFLAGVSLLSIQIAFLGLVMGLAVPAISWLQQSVIFFLLGAVLLIGLGLAFWLRQDRQPHTARTSKQNQMEA
jgi:hypothetical protein